MPFTVVFEKQYKNVKSGTRARIAVPAFLRLKKTGHVKRVMTTPKDLKKKVIDPETYKSKPKGAPKAKKTKGKAKTKKGINPNSLKNLLKPNKSK